MKQRNGFVSNSSSSSFIIGIAPVSDDKLERARELFDTDVIDIVQYICDQGDGHYQLDYTSSPNKVSIESFMGDSYDINLDDALENGIKHFVYLSESGDEPQYDDNSWEYNYDDIDLDWFSDSDVERYQFIQENGGDGTFGGGYNG